MGAKKIILYWLMLLVPTLLIGGYALHLLRYESDRLERVARDASRDKAALCVDSIRLTINGIKETIIADLKAFPVDKRDDELWSEELENPFVRNSFLFQTSVGVIMPNVKEQQVPEKVEFIRRYDGLFSGRIPWFIDRAEEQEQAPARNVRRARNSPVEIVQQAKYYKQGQWNRDDTRKIPLKTGWVPWFWEDQFYMLGVVYDETAGQTFGVEVETITLLSHLYETLPEEMSANEVFVLRDKNGRIFHQRGLREIEDNEEARITVNVGPSLPHFEVAVFGTPAGGGSYGSSLGFLTVSSLLVGTFVLAIIIGGSLLIWQAHSNLLDARQKTNFVSNVSHELKTPLTTIRMYAELLSEGRITDETKKAKSMQVIVDESQRLTRLVDNVLDFSRLEQGRKKYVLEALDLHRFLANLSEMQAPRIEHAGMQLLTELSPDSVTVEADRDALEQIVLNLIDNAAKYARDGNEILLSTAIQADRALIRIRDRGPGIAKDQQKLIFDKFHRVDDSLTASVAGSGLGLSIARRLAEDMEGALSYTEREGGGSTFTFALRILSAPQPTNESKIAV